MYNGPMSKTYNHGPEADVIVGRQLAKGNYGSADEVVRAGLRLLEEHEAELEELRKLIDSTATSPTPRPSCPAP
jgi:antitoxin ParD1/3/4